MHFDAKFLLDFYPTKHINSDYKVLRDEKYVECLVIECLNRAKSAKNKLYDRFNFNILSTISGGLIASTITDWWILSNSEKILKSRIWRRST